MMGNYSTPRITLFSAISMRFLRLEGCASGARPGMQLETGTRWGSREESRRVSNLFKLVQIDERERRFRSSFFPGKKKNSTAHDDPRSPSPPRALFALFPTRRRRQGHRPPQARPGRPRRGPTLRHQRLESGFPEEEAAAPEAAQGRAGGGAVPRVRAPAAGRLRLVLAAVQARGGGGGGGGTGTRGRVLRRERRDRRRGDVGRRRRRSSLCVGDRRRRLCHCRRSYSRRCRRCCLGAADARLLGRDGKPQEPPESEQ